MLRASAHALRGAGLGLLYAGLLGVVWATAAAPALAQVDLPEPNLSDPITVSADVANHWMEGSYEVWLLRGNCQLRQGMTSVKGREAVLWILRADFPDRQPNRVIAFFEGDNAAKVAVDMPKGMSKAQLRDNQWLGRFRTSAAVEVRAPSVSGRPDVLPAVYEHGLAQRASRPVQGGTAGGHAPSGPPAWLGAPSDAYIPSGTRRIRVFQRSSVPFHFQWAPQEPGSNQAIALVDCGVNLIVDGLAGVGSIDVSADRMVIWTAGLQNQDLGSGDGARQPESQPLEIYMEGNVKFLQGTREIYADRMYYDVRNHVGTVIHAEILTPVRTYQGKLRLKADIVEQYDQDRFSAQHAMVTSSRIGNPTYRMELGDVTFHDVQTPEMDSFGRPVEDPQTHEPQVVHEKLAEGDNSVVYVGPVPVFYWPTFASDLNDPTYYIRGIRIHDDTIFGYGAMVDFNAYQLLGIRHPPTGTDWDVSLDYRSLRGLGVGSTFQYHRDNLFGLCGPTSGLIDFYAIDDHGLDTLGGGRSDLEPEVPLRYRLFANHRQLLPDGYQLSVEVGLLSDRNFEEEYFPQEWQSLKDPTTGVELKRTQDNYSYGITANVRVDDFFTQTEWLPRLDHYWLGQPLLNDTFTWYEHSQAGYADLQVANPAIVTAASTPNMQQAFTYLPWEANVSGERLVSRQEIDWPVQLGVVKVVPYALGEVADWGEDLSGQRIQRAYGVGGIRASMPMWSVDPDVESTLWNLHGIAHKVVFDVDCSFAQSTQSLDQFPLYDPVDDINIEEFRRRIIAYDFPTPGVNYYSLPPPPPGKPLPPQYAQFDERYYALRSGLGDWVDSPSTEIADDLTAIRCGIEQRWQTKRGMPGDQHEVDWISLDTHCTFFPDPTRDDFGRVLGLLDYDFTWNVGDRLTFVSNGIFDFFSQGQQIATFGMFLTRPPRASVYMGLTSLEGPISETVFSVSYSYWMSPKWISTLGTSVNLSGGKSIGENFTVTRVGESFLISGVFTVDAIRQTTGVSLMVEPRFLPKGRQGAPGARVPPAGAFGLE
jgi:lipopolysaccharide export system protein LptA